MEIKHVLLQQESQSQTKSEVGPRKNCQILWICVCQEGLLLNTNAGPVFMQLRLCLKVLNDSTPRFPLLLTPWRLRPFLVIWYRPQTPGIFQQHGVSWCESSLSKRSEVWNLCIKIWFISLRMGHFLPSPFQPFWVWVLRVRDNMIWK